MSNLNNTRKVINKYSNSENDIKNYSLLDGEMVISTVKENEGIYIKNENGELVKIGNIDKSHIETIVNEIMAESGVPKHQDLTETEYNTLIEVGKVTLKDGTEITYNDDVYYMILEDDVE